MLWLKMLIPVLWHMPPNFSWRSVFCRSLPGFVTVAAIEAGFIGTVAVHAAAHRDVGLFFDYVALGDGAVAGLALRPRIEMCLVAERNIAGDLVYTHPGHIALFLQVTGQFADVRAIRFHRPVARHALCRGGECHHLAWLRHGMAVTAFQPQRNVLLVAVRNRLRDSRRGEG